MATVHLANVDENGNFLSPAVNARLNEKYGAGGSEGPAITAVTTLDDLATTENGA